MPRFPEADATVVLNAAWFWSASEIEIEPEAFRTGLVASSVTSTAFGVPMTAASLTPTIVKATCFWVPSREVIVKVSTLVSPAPRYCTLLSATE
ncbi:hypothetical protein ACVW1A_004809 [Bradyrhizobium sp. LB1.3]